ncbi:hypothetical protein [Streptomyces acidiscabies]|uniref:Alpha/beta hydrolase family protein n=1 Tax=Streptomyces acidiscabies TaxID=42234 RepID=A0AAP6BBY6_9ACTN|nr:hypothetical protein [Streptomyces acidiscabies]MDX2961916.1 hypothetical protein [Streptomyces acidiscabies]MDX3021800.1 hypothetical protein [Streptomyces acidiscabies]MDX3789457.1 hypothetical protein [Streptomyces acidiscabies]GAQ50441.1 hypothetical protein a10_00218 [Streptomyces acidiscabies]GAV37345.1 hypothetical protein Saa2_00218 [Streptomyces acidiscabies]
MNPYDYRDGTARSGLLARMVIGGIIAPGVGKVIAEQEPKPVLRRILQGGVGDKAAFREDYLDELLQSGRRPGRRPRPVPEHAQPHRGPLALPAADFTQVPGADHFIALERPDVVADLLHAMV